MSRIVGLGCQGRHIISRIWIPALAMPMLVNDEKGQIINQTLSLRGNLVGFSSRTDSVVG